MSSILTSCFSGSTRRLPLTLGADALHVCRKLGISSRWSMCVVAGEVRAYLDTVQHELEREYKWLRRERQVLALTLVGVHA